MLEKIKEIPFIDESRAVKVKVLGGKLTIERTDKVVWGQEVFDRPTWPDVADCYVEEDKFFALFEQIAVLRNVGPHLEVTLMNGAKYELPFLEVSWNAQQMPEQYDQTITFRLADLMICTLANLIKPEFQCIRIDDKGAVSCDFVSSCVSKSMIAQKPFMLPPELQPLVDARLCSVKVTDTKIFVKANDFSLVTTCPTTSGDAWWEQLRAMIPEGLNFVEFSPDALKRLMMFGDYIEFKDGKVLCGSNFEPFPSFEPLPGRKYEADKILRIMSTATKIASYEGNLILKNDSAMFLVSPVDEA
jgi:hypothetical protein